MELRNQSSAPGFPTRGFMRPVPLSAEPEAPPVPATPPPLPVPPTPPAAPKPEVPVVPPAAPPTPVPPASKPPDNEVQALLADLKAKSAELDRVLGETKGGLAKERAAERRDYVRGMSLAVDLNDEQLDRQLAGLEDADVRTTEGKAKLNKFREDNATLFRGAVPAPKVSLDETVKIIVGGEKNLNRKIFGARAVLGLIVENPPGDII